MNSAILVPNSGITRDFIKINRHILTFLYGDNYQRIGYNAQTAICKGEPNAFPISTKKLACMQYPSAFFFDTEFELLSKFEIDKSFEEIPPSEMVKPVVMLRGLGAEGDGSQLNVHAPKTYSYLMNKIKSLPTYTTTYYEQI